MNSQLYWCQKPTLWSFLSPHSWCCCPSAVCVCFLNVYCTSDFTALTCCVFAGGQRWRKHRQLSLLPASLHDPLAERRGVQRHHRRPQKVRTQAHKHTSALTASSFFPPPHDTHTLLPLQKAGRPAQPGPGDAPSVPDLQRGGQDRYQQDRGVPGGNAQPSKVTRLEGFTTRSLQYQIISPATHTHTHTHTRCFSLDLFHFGSAVERAGNI